MLGSLFRGLFILGIVGWYSAAIWKLIDSYFKDQFKRYLDQEYERYPKMRKEVLNYESVGNAENDVIGQLSSNEEFCDMHVTDFCVNKNDADDNSIEASVSSSNKENAEEEERQQVGSVDDVAELKEVTKESGIDNNKIEYYDGEDDDESMQSRQSDFENPSKLATFDVQEDNENEFFMDHVNNVDSKMEINGQHEYQENKNVAQDTGQRKTDYYDDEDDMSQEAYDCYEDEDDDNYYEVKNLHVKHEFEGTNDDFDDDLEVKKSKKSVKMMRVKDLPYNPKVDIYDLDELSADEFCPLTINENEDEDYEGSCNQLNTWP